MQCMEYTQNIRAVAWAAPDFRGKWGGDGRGGEGVQTARNGGGTRHDTG